MMSLAYNLACLESDTYDFNDGYKRLSKVIDMEYRSYLYDLAIASKNKSAFLQMVA